MFIKQCQYCGKTFCAGKSTQKYCSRDCLYSSQRSREEHICKYCGKQFMPKATDRTTYCSRECYFKNGGSGGRKAKPCLLCGRVTNKKTNGYCRECRDKLSVVECTYCGKEFKSEHNKRYCSDECLRKINLKKCLIRNRNKKNVITIKCKECGEEFTSVYGDFRSKFCCKKCQVKFSRRWVRENHPEIKRDQNHRRRARLHNCKAEKINSLEIYERDNWKCHVCGKKVNKKKKVPHPLSPTLDHYIPLAYRGSHTKDNVRCAHFICNSRRGVPRRIQLNICC